MTQLFDRLATMLATDGQAVLVSVSEVRGSAPREVGAGMAICADGGFSGTIGGGALEWQAFAEAQAFLAASSATTIRTMTRSLGPDLGQCCGGRVKLTLERFGAEDAAWVGALAASDACVSIGTPTPTGHFRRRAALPEELVLLRPGEDRRVLADGRIVERLAARSTPLLLFGAGHVGRAIVLAFAPLPFSLSWIDPRPGSFPGHAPRNVDAIVDADPARRIAAAPDGAMVLAMTHSHALDLEIASAALSTRRFALVGVIGSATKRARFASFLRQAGHDDDAIARLVCPIGLPGINGKEPATIAAAVAAQCLLLREALLSKAVENPAMEGLASSQGSADRL